MTISLAVFDVDGTLIDSGDTIHRHLAEAAIELGLDPPTRRESLSIIGRSLTDAIGDLFPRLEAAQIDTYAETYKAAYLRSHEAGQINDRLFAGADACLRHLKASGWQLGMATGNSRRGINRNLEVFGWHGLFDCAFCADDGPSKPHPHMLEANLRHVGVTPSQAVMIGDTAHDVRMARFADVTAIGVAWGCHDVDELVAAGAHHIVEDFPHLLEVLKALSGEAEGRVA